MYKFIFKKIYTLSESASTAPNFTIPLRTLAAFSHSGVKFLQ